MQFFGTIFSLLAFAALSFGRTETNNSNIKVLLIAGSSGWGNYRHQADISHAYQVLRKRNIPAGNIVTMMYDDIATNPQNPFQGKIFNHPSLKDDVYGGVQIDYKGNDITEKNFLCAMSGDKECVKGVGTGRVLESGHDDDVFVYYADHGGDSILGLPTGEVIHRQKLIATLKHMHANNRYKKLVLYIEACESGSMSVGLPNDINIFVATASNAEESSWATYCDNKSGLPCLGDEFSVNWIEDSCAHTCKDYTIDQQVSTVKKETKKSHVSEFGCMDIGSQRISDFEGESKKEGEIERTPVFDTADYISVESTDAEMYYATKQMKIATSMKERFMHLTSVVNLNNQKKINSQVVEGVLANLHLTKGDVQNLMPPMYSNESDTCHSLVMSKIGECCDGLGNNAYLMRSSKTFYAICTTQIGTSQIMKAIEMVCKH